MHPERGPLPAILLASLLCFSLSALPLTAKAQTLTSVQAELSAEIQSAQQGLMTTETDINNARQSLGDSLNQLEREVNRLRDENAATRRATDERDLSLSRLQDRRSQWQEQSQYQQYLLDSFLNRGNSEQLPEELDMAARLDRLEQQIDGLALGLAPTWEQEQVVLSSGELQAMHTLSIGPVSWYFDQASASGGFITREGELPEVIHALDNSASAELATLLENGSGNITFDPTLDRSLRINEQRETPIEHVRKGGFWVLPILLFGALALLIGIGKAVQLWRQPAFSATVEKQLDTLLHGNSEDAMQKLRQQLQGYQRKLLDIVLSTPPGQSREDLLFSALMTQKRQLEHWLGAIAVIAAVSPLLGLLGTVSGMIETFQLMTLFGAGDPEAVSSGISKALITTELGLIVAIPALLIHAILSRRVKACRARLEHMAVQLNQLPAVGATHATG